METFKGHKPDTSFFSPFQRWSKDGSYFGLCVQDGKVIQGAEPDEGNARNWIEYHLTYYGGDIWELECNPTENTGNVVYRGRVPNRPFLVSILSNLEIPFMR